MKKTVLILIILVLNVSTITANDFPEFSNWKTLSEVMYYNPDNLWEYINGAADQFIDYGFLTVGVGEFETEGVQFSVDIYDMGNPLNAFGVFATESRGVKNRYDIGTLAAISLPSQALMFKGKYYIKIYAFEGELNESSGKIFLKDIAEKLDGSTELPAVLQKLPGSDKINGSEGFTRLGFLGLSDLKNCLYADYMDENGEKYQFFLVKPEKDRTDKETFENIDKGWKALEWQQNKVKTRKIPYQGITAVILLPGGLYGVSNAATPDIALERLKIFIQ